MKIFAFCISLFATLLSLSTGVLAENVRIPTTVDQIGDPLEIDPLLGLEINTLRRMLNEALARLDTLEERLDGLEGILQTAEDQ